MQEKPRLAIVGVGDYYRMLSPGIAKEFETVVKVDRQDYESTSGALRDLVGSHKPDAVMVLTPNRFHAEHIAEISQLGVPIFVEKPLVTTPEALESVLASAAMNPALYCSDFYVDVWDVPLLRWLGLKTAKHFDDWLEIRDSSCEDWQRGKEVLGDIVSVEATLLEGTGPASSFVGREWLWDAEHGGVLWDMGYHDLALWFRIIGEPLTVLSVERFTIPTSPPNSAETYGAVKMVSESGIEFNIRVGKYVEGGDNRAFKIIGTKGEVSMDFVLPGRLVLNGDTANPLAVLRGEWLDHASAAFREYVESRPPEPHGLDIAVKCVKQMFEIRRL